jgi:hypothetical protein
MGTYQRAWRVGQPLNGVELQGAASFAFFFCAKDASKMGKSMSESVKRVIAMTLITLVISMIGAGGYKDLLSGLFVAAIALLWSIPTALLIMGFQALERVLGKRGPYIISMVGLAPLLLVIGFGGRGDHVFMAVIVFSGLVWSAAWIATYMHFLKSPQ